MIRFFNPGLTYKKYEKEIDDGFKRVLSEGQLILRKDVEDFEKTLASFVGTKYAVALNSCTDALYLALRGLKIGPGDEVLVPSRTFVASVQVIVQVGATPVFYDVGGDINFTEKTKAIIPVHIEGAFGADMTKLVEVCSKRGVYIIEDAAQALGAVQNNKMAGSFGIAGCFSFYPAKILGAFGDAGALVTNDEEMYNYVKDARNHFKDDARDWGVNSRLDNIQAVVLNIRIKDIWKMLARRQEIAEMYQEGLKDLSWLKLPSHTEGRVWQDYIVRIVGIGTENYNNDTAIFQSCDLGKRVIKTRDELYQYLKDNGVETLKNNYPFPVPKLPGAQKYEDETLRLPCNENLTNEEIYQVIELIKKF